MSHSDEAEAIATELACFSVALGAGAIDPRLRRRAALHLLDAVGCGLAAVGLGAGASATAVAVAQGGVAEASALGVPGKLPAPLAALANGTRFHALDFDDTHEAGICHSSAVLAAAALAAGEAAGVDGGEILDSFLIGSEVALRISTAIADRIYSRGFHPTSICGSFGAAAACSRLLGLDAETTVNALGIVGSFAAGLLEYLADGSATKPLHAGWAAQAGIQAARLARAGATGPASVLEGRFGLIASHAGPGEDPRMVCDRLAEDWTFEQISFKAFPVCHFAHSSTWAALELARANDLDASDLAQIVVWVPPEGAPLVLDPIDDKRVPRTSYDAKFSLPYTLAYNVIRGELGLRAFSEAAIRDEQVLSLAARVVAEPAPDRRPSRFCGGAELVTTAGERYKMLVDNVPGSPANPIGEARVLAKFEDNASFALSGPEAAGLMQRLLALDREPSAEAAMATVRAAVSRG